MDRTKLNELFRAWADLQPCLTVREEQIITYHDVHGRLKSFVEKQRFDGSCCYLHHFIKEGGASINRPDNEVCKREQAWRAYVRERNRLEILVTTVN